MDTMKIRKTDWLILDMDEGLLRVEPTRRDAVTWCTEQDGYVVRGRHCYGPGAYEYGFWWKGNEDSGHGLFIERFDTVGPTGWMWAVEQGARYPHPDQPYKRIDED